MYAVRFLVGSMRGASTGEICSSPQHWAAEVRMRLDEEVGTRQIDAAGRTRLSAEVILLDL
jgi:hypothetical protein